MAAPDHSQKDPLKNQREFYVRELYKTNAQIVRDIGNLLSVEGQILLAIIHEEMPISILRKYIKASRSSLYNKISKLVECNKLFYITKSEINNELYLKINPGEREKILKELGNIISCKFE